VIEYSELKKEGSGAEITYRVSNFPYYLQKLQRIRWHVNSHRTRTRKEAAAKVGRTSLLKDRRRDLGVDVAAAKEKEGNNRRRE
jgi:hypothetical protein